jgi:hypothetical protein
VSKARRLMTATDLPTFPGHAALPLNSDRRADKLACLFRVNQRHSRCSKPRPYSITSSAMESTPDGTSMPSIRAV